MGNCRQFDLRVEGGDAFGSVDDCVVYEQYSDEFAVLLCLPSFLILDLKTCE